MVSTRRSPRRVASDEDSKLLNDKSPAKTPKKQTRKTRPKEELKSKNTGLGITIAVHEEEAMKQNKKIVFGDDDDVTDELLQETTQQNHKDEKDHTSSKVETDHKDEDDNDDDDDAVEEIKGSAAREEIMQQLEAEIKGASKSKKAKKRKDRKKEDTVDEDDDDDDDLDDNFFAQLETIKAEEEKKKITESKKKSKGKHTTFVFGENDKSTKIGDASAPKKVGHNIQVVVLEDQEEATTNDSFTAIPTSTLTKEALLLSRSELPDGTDQGQNRKRNAPNLPDTSWKRSRKMNLVVTPKSRFNRRGGRGFPAANFATKTNN